MKMEVLLLAAGTGSRMGNFTTDTPKSLIPLNGIPLIDYILKHLLYLDISHIVFVVGYLKKRLITHVKKNYAKDLEFDFAFNDEIDRENGYSLYCARNLIESNNFLVIMGDHIVDTEIYKRAFEGASTAEIILATDRFSNLNNPEEATKVLLKGNRILKIGKNLTEYSAYDTGVFAMSRAIFPVLRSLSQNQYVVTISDLVNSCIRKKMRVRSCDISGYFWMDLDTEEDIELLLQRVQTVDRNTEYDEIL